MPSKTPLQGSQKLHRQHVQLGQATVSSLELDSCLSSRISRLANAVGTEEPIHGPSAIQAVTQQAKEVPYTELKKEDLKWTVMDSTNVETHTFYLMSEQGHIGMAQIIYSNVL